MERGFLKQLFDSKGRINRRAVETLMARMESERERLRRLLEYIPEGVVLLDRDGRVELSNEVLHRILGLPGGGLMGTQVRDGLKGTLIEDVFIEVLRSRSRIVEREVRLTHPWERLVIVNAVPIEQDGSLSGVAVFVLDTTARTERDDRLRRQERVSALTTMSATLAHELRNPLNSMSIHIQLLERELNRTEWDGDRDSLRIVRTEIGRLNELLEDFLVAARPTKPQFGPTDPRQLVTSALDLLQPAISGNRVDVVIEEPEAWPEMVADGGQLRRAVINIVKNAVEAMPDGGTLTISAEPGKEAIVLAFRDTGCGMDEEARAHLFEPYYTTKRTGTGLGMVAVERIVREHAGAVVVRSEPGIGTSVSVRLPLVPPSRGLLGHSTNPAHTTVETMRGNPR